MRFSTIISSASTLALLAAFASAQETPDLSNLVACQTCFNQALTSTSPACKNAPINNTNGELSDKQKSCLCGLVSNKGWGASCVQPDKCSASLVESITAIYESLAKSGVCDNVSVTSAAVVGAAVGSVKVFVAAAGTAMVIAGALL
ncbi:hypothetical protein EC991_008837 [Linnemannia zychae]|nr:hypothetical protein EC991_008837 [Linnemannia zychae]